MQYQDFERDGDFYHSYNKQKIQPSQSRRTPPKTFTPQDLLKMFGAVVAIFIPLIFVLGMLSGNGNVLSSATMTGIFVIGLAFIVAIVLIGFGVVRLCSLLFNGKRVR